MKTVFFSSTLAATAACMAIAPSVNIAAIKERSIHDPDVNPTTVDSTATRSQWVSAYKIPRDAQKSEAGFTVDSTATRSQWVSAYNSPRDGQDLAVAVPLASNGDKDLTGSDHWVCIRLNLVDRGTDGLEATKWTRISRCQRS
ncbi:hypothetical protein EJ05DRAFT_472167 [Pseudovirgaria hyperparasitica]|uniref:Uncharacterized protein n=1 Tax=Pseudovirgaria hyperparasitica TaxID=470096 RepID=A0A6A6WM22_9PEZI|nr:uncharacterized protein EJ05DRAFT_472167 [Pseudovirgaria hyperparasitica]KAF2763254.1 hypothetical protein EJ05DRAFT_472167 [Pseudovirgaria hyperparasitica]